MYKPLVTTKSQEIYRNLCHLIPGGVNSPVRACLAVGHDPIIAEQGNGAVLSDADGNCYIDYCLSWGALILGHCHPTVTEQAIARLKKGSTFGMSTEIEARLAHKVIQLMPSIEKIRFVSTGTEATMSAVRLARGFTERSLVIKLDGCYHGHADHFLIRAGSGVGGYLQDASSKGVTSDAVKDTRSLPFNDVDQVRDAIRTHRDQLAAVILEPVAGNMGVVSASSEFISMLREETTECGALLIFDEVMSGFRVALGGAQALFNVTPDLTCLGKIVGGGYPAAAFGGRADIMELLAPLGPVYQAGTLSGNPIAMEAGYQTLTLLERHGFYEDLERKKQLLIEGAGDRFRIQHQGAMFTPFLSGEPIVNFQDALRCNKEDYARLFKHMLDRGIYIPPLQLEAWFLSAAHTDQQIQQTAKALRSFC